VNFVSREVRQKKSMRNTRKQRKIILLRMSATHKLTTILSTEGHKVTKTGVFLQIKLLQCMYVCMRDYGCDFVFSWEEKLVAPLIATPNVDKAIEDKKDGQKSYATGCMCNSRLQKGITILFCKQIGQCPSTNYASSLSGFKILGKLKWRDLCSRQFLS
jgi:hypothetical protein